MELFFFRHAEYERLYNCTGLDIDSIPLERRQFVPESIAVCVLCAIYYVLYVPCMYSIWKHMRDNSCYKLLFYVGITDLDILWILGFFSGLANLRGDVFCSYPTLMYFVGMAVTALWSAESSADLYEHWLHRVHNIVVAFLSPLIYLIFAAKLFYDLQKNRRQFGVVVSEMGAMQIRIFSQVFLVSLMNTFAGFLYVYIQSIEVHQWMITFAEFAWLHVHGFPPVIYLALNKTIREDCRLLYAKLFQRHRIGHIGGVTVLRPETNPPNGVRSII
ncbi:hypothetical protein GPALN_003423 [Globodera pallida]|nr:hypothetical protein GPALN_003423 [Globodera pallida]